MPALTRFIHTRWEMANIPTIMLLSGCLTAFILKPAGLTVSVALRSEAYCQRSTGET